MNHYWVEENKLLAGEYPRNVDDASSQRKMDVLIELGVTAFVDLTHDDDGMEPYTHFINGHDIVYRRFPIRDRSVPRSAAWAREILDAIDGHIGDGRVVYVHCWGGVGRTGTIVGCWLSRHGYPGRSALERLQELWSSNPKADWRRSPETSEQERYIVDWNESHR